MWLLMLILKNEADINNDETAIDLYTIKKDNEAPCI